MADKRILIVDDEKNFTTALDSFFKSKGHHISIANSGEAALEILKEEGIDLLILDLNMPGIDGTAVAKTVQEKYPKTKILILSAYSDEYKDKLAFLGRNEIITKPFGIFMLISKVQELLGEQIVLEPEPEYAVKFKPVKVLFIDPAMSYVLKDYVFPYIRLSWSRNIEVDSVGPTSPSAISEKIIFFKPDIILLSAVLIKQAEEISRNISMNIYKPKEVVFYNMPDEKAVKESPLNAYYSMQKSLMDPDYLSRVNELIKDIALRHRLIDKTAFSKEKPKLPLKSIKEFKADDVADFVKEAISGELGLKGVKLKDDTSFVKALGVDSLGSIRLTMALEEAFGIEIPDEDIGKLQTIGDTVEYIKKKVNLAALARRKKSTHTILVVDDQEGTCNFLVNYFISKGYRAVSASQSKTALEMVKSEKPDVVLLDIRMPDMDGVELLREVKRLDPLTKVIMVTVASEREGEAKGCGADAFISKPFPIFYLEETVIKKIQDMIGEHSA